MYAVQVRRQDAVQQLENSLEGQLGSTAAEDAGLLVSNGPADVAGILTGAVTGDDGTTNGLKAKRQIPLQGEIGDELADLASVVPKE